MALTRRPHQVPPSACLRVIRQRFEDDLSRFTDWKAVCPTPEIAYVLYLLRETSRQNRDLGSGPVSRPSDTAASRHTDDMW